jgi:hypothetical protein
MSALHRIERYLSATGTPWSRFGRIVASDPRLVQDMRNGRQPRASMIARIEAYLAKEGF